MWSTDSQVTEGVEVFQRFRLRYTDRCYTPGPYPRHRDVNGIKTDV